MKYNLLKQVYRYFFDRQSGTYKKTKKKNSTLLVKKKKAPLSEYHVSNHMYGCLKST